MRESYQNVIVYFLVLVLLKEPTEVIYFNDFFARSLKIEEEPDRTRSKKSVNDVDTRVMENFKQRANWVHEFGYKKCGMNDVLKVSRSSENLRHVYGKYPDMRCGKFLGWLDECEDKSSKKTPSHVEPTLSSDNSFELLELKRGRFQRECCWCICARKTLVSSDGQQQCNRGGGCDEDADCCYFRRGQGDEEGHV